MQTLRSNNARLTSALQESNTNVDEWKVQLAAYKDENSQMKAKVCCITGCLTTLEILEIYWNLLSFWNSWNSTGIL